VELLPVRVPPLLESGSVMHLRPSLQVPPVQRCRKATQYPGLQGVRCVVGGAFKGLAGRGVGTVVLHAGRLRIPGGLQEAKVFPGPGRVLVLVGHGLISG
jgi:hypothetical protein